MNNAKFQGMTLRNTDVCGVRVVRKHLRHEAMAMRTLHYRNGFKLVYRNKWPSRSWVPRFRYKCPWWAFPRCRGNLFETRWQLAGSINAKRVTP